MSGTSSNVADVVPYFKHFMVSSPTSLLDWTPTGVNVTSASTPSTLSNSCGSSGPLWRSRSFGRSCLLSSSPSKKHPLVSAGGGAYFDRTPFFLKSAIETVQGSLKQNQQCRHSPNRWQVCRPCHRPCSWRGGGGVWPHPQFSLEYFQILPKYQLCLPETLSTGVGQRNFWKLSKSSENTKIHTKWFSRHMFCCLVYRILHSWRENETFSRWYSLFLSPVFSSSTCSLLMETLFMSCASLRVRLNCV